MVQDWEQDLPHIVPASALKTQCSQSLVSREGLTRSAQHTAYPLGTQEPGCFLLSYEPPRDKRGQGRVRSSHCSKKQFGGRWKCHGSPYCS